MFDELSASRSGAAAIDRPPSTGARCGPCADALDLKLRDAERRRREAEQTLQRQAASWALVVRELRSPLMSVQTVSALMSKGSDAVDLQALACVLERQVRHMTRLTNELLCDARIPADRSAD